MSNFRSMANTLLGILLFQILTFSDLSAQQTYWSNVETYPGYQQPMQLQFQEGKGLWAVSTGGIHFVDAKTHKVTTYNMDDSGKVVTGLRTLAIAQNNVYSSTSSELFKLSGNGKLQRIATGKNPSQNPNWVSLYSDGESVTLSSYFQVVLLKNDQIVGTSSLPTTRRPSRTAARSMAHLLFDMGKYIVHGSISYAGATIFNKATKTDFSFSYDNPVSYYYQKGKGLWLLGNREISFLSPDTAAPVKQVITLAAGETTEKLTIDADNKLVIHTSKFLYEVNMGETKKIEIVKQVNKTAFPSFVYRKPIAIVGSNYYHSDEKGLYLTQASTTTTLIKNLIPASGMTTYNKWMTDGFVYTRDKTDLYFYNGKQEPGKIESIGYGSGIFTDGKKIYFTKGSSVYTKDSKGGLGQLLFEVPTSRELHAAAAPDGSIYVACQDGVGMYEKGKFTFKPRAEIQTYPGSALQSIALSPKKELILFFSQPYQYNEGKLTILPGSFNGLIYTSYFDGLGGMYSTGIGDALYYDGKTVADLKTLIKIHFRQQPSDGVYLGGLTVDYKGRCWVVATVNAEKSLLIFENGKIIDQLTVEQVPLLKNADLTLYSKGKELLMLTPGSGMSIYKLK